MTTIYRDNKSLLCKQVSCNSFLYCFNKPVKVLFQTYSFCLLHCFAHIITDPNLCHIFFGLNQGFSYQHLKFKQRHGLNFVQITKNCELCVSIIMQRMTLWLIIKMPFGGEIVNTKNGKKYWPLL